MDAVALTVNGDGVITSCQLDSLQGKVAIDENGAVGDMNVNTKNTLGFDYGMVTWAGATYEWFEQALAAASTPLFRNNIRMMRMAIRYSDLVTHDPLHKVCSVWQMEYEDATGELAYMAKNFDSFVYSKTGYGIDFPVSNTDTKNFQPDKWYLFD